MTYTTERPTKNTGEKACCYTCAQTETEFQWLTYIEAAEYMTWSVAHLRNLVSADKIPVYGKPRTRRFRKDMLNLFLTNPDAAMRKFRMERNSHGS